MLHTAAQAVATSDLVQIALAAMNVAQTIALAIIADRSRRVRRSSR